MKKGLFFLLLLSLISCKDEEDSFSYETNTKQEYNCSVTDEGYLHFNSQFAFDEHMRKIESGGLKSSTQGGGDFSL